MKKILSILLILATITTLLCACVPSSFVSSNPKEPYKILNNNVPYFTEDEITAKAYEFYSELDSLGRCGVVHASVGPELMPADGEKRGSISSVYPSGWEQAEYPEDLVDGGFLYNRAHLIGWQLTAENANKKNLITGTRYFNVDGMLPFENMVADYIRETGNHVIYRVTPIYEGNNLVASGVLMEAKSVEDDEICFCVYVYNAQPGITIDYRNGNSALSGETLPEPEEETEQTPEYYVLNTSSKKFHEPTCSGANSISESNKQTYTGDRQSLIDQGYSPCGICKP